MRFNLGSVLELWRAHSMRGFGFVQHASSRYMKMSCFRANSPDGIIHRRGKIVTEGLTAVGLRMRGLHLGEGTGIRRGR